MSKHDGLIERVSRMRLFLNGETDLDGTWFGDNPVPAMARGVFWWRMPMQRDLYEAIAAIRELEAALEPFARHADKQDEFRRRDDEGFCSRIIHGSTGAITEITVGDLRRARLALGREDQSNGPS